jgi:hypothetical protein
MLLNFFTPLGQAFSFNAAPVHCSPTITLPWCLVGLLLVQVLSSSIFSGRW